MIPVNLTLGFFVDLEAVIVPVSLCNNAVILELSRRNVKYILCRIEG